MHVGEIGDEEVLVTTDDSGHVAVHFPQQPCRPELVFKMPMSAWGIDTHSEKRLLAISCNVHIVTVFHLGFGIEGWEWTTTTPSASTGDADAAPSLTMQGHQNNIPCVAFDRNGEYVVSGSLDETIRMWDCRTGQCVLRLMTREYRHLLSSVDPAFLLSDTVCFVFHSLTVEYGQSNSSINPTSSTTALPKKVSLPLPLSSRRWESDFHS